MIRTVKDFMIEYTVEHPMEPDEDAWMVAYEQMIDQADQEKDDDWE